jgi:hypothetical protein
MEGSTTQLLRSVPPEADPPLRLLRYGHQAAHGLKQGHNVLVVSGDLPFQFIQLGGELAVGGQKLAKAHKGARDQDAQVDGLGRVEHRCGRR